MTAWPDDNDGGAGAALRARQERLVALSHSLTAAEYALAHEACAVARTFEEAGLDFDPITFVVMRLLEGSFAEQADPVDCLLLLDQLGLLDRSVALTRDLLDEAA
jgi:hypothetical protein